MQNSLQESCMMRKTEKPVSGAFLGGADWNPKATSAVNVRNLNSLDIILDLKKDDSLYYVYT